MLGEAVAHDFDLLKFAFHFEFLAFEQHEPAREFFHDLAAPFVEFALLAAELVELLFLPFDFLLLPFQVEQLFFDALDLEVDLVGRRGVALSGRRGRQQFLFFDVIFFGSGGGSGFAGHEK